MKIVPILVENLYACQYNGEAHNEYARIMDLWDDVLYLREYAQENNISDMRGFVMEVRTNARYIDDLIEHINKGHALLETFFRPLNDLESGTKVLSLQKGKRYQLRIYAIRLDVNLFIITGGAIKLVHKMKEHQDTQIELVKLNHVKTYLKNNFVFDSDSFYELMNENYEDE